MGWRISAQKRRNNQRKGYILLSKHRKTFKHCIKRINKEKGKNKPLKTIFLHQISNNETGKSQKKKESR